MKVLPLLFLLLFFVIAAPASVKAQPMDSTGARCFKIINQAPYTVYGSIYTNFYLTSSGAAGRKQSNFRLESNKNVEFCSFGPFYGEENDRLNLVLRTLIPIFSCYFKAEGDLIIYGRRKEEGGTKTWATCL